MRPVHRSMVLALPVALGSLSAQRAAGQTPSVRIAGRVQAQFSTVSGDSTGSFDPSASVSSAFEIRRLRFQADVRIGENVNLVIQPSFEMGALRMRDGYLRVLLARNAAASLGLTMGQEKKPFNRYELTSSNALLSIERGARFRGLSDVAAQNNLLEENGYLAHDIGAILDATLAQGRLVAKLGAYNGSGESAADVNDAKTYAGRVAYTALQDPEARPVLRLGAAAISRDRAVTTTARSTSFAPDSSRRTSAFALDLEWGDFRPGLHVIADFAAGTGIRPASCPDTLGSAAGSTVPCTFTTGRNAGNLRPGAPDSAFATFRSLHVVASWRWQPDDPDGTRLIKIVEPALRLDLTDPDTDTDGDAGLLITPVLNLHFSQTTVLRAGLDLYRYQDAGGAGRSVRALRVSWQSNF
jgi:hypothetical protein